MSDDTSPFEILPAEEIESLLTSYSEISFLAKGGMAAVYRGVQTSLERPVAIKVLPREFGADESFRLRFVAEGKAMARLNHPNLVGIFDFGQVDGLLYIVMEFVEGQTLYEYAYGSPMNELEAIDLCQKVADGLSHAHKHGILHRDIKPANVLLDENLDPKLGDFGLAEGEERDEGDDLVFGTPGYTSPEVMENPGGADEKADIFAIGIMLYELLTTTIPEAPYQPPSRLTNTDTRIDEVIARAIQPDPAHRYATAKDLANSLKDLHQKMTSSPRRKLATQSPAAGTARTLAVAPAQLHSGASKKQALTSGKALTVSNSLTSRPASVKVNAAPSNLPLIRNLIIIGVLSVAILVAWDALQKKNAREARVEQLQTEKAERSARKKEVKAKLLAEEREARGTRESKERKGSTPTDDPSLSEPSSPPQALSPRKQLAELQSALKEGERDRFPDGTQQRGSAHYFFIEDALTWHQAIEFAERHGAHLAITPKESDLNWLAEAIPTEDDIWLGAGAISRSDWAWFDDSVDFEFKKPRTSTGTAAMITNIGVLKARDASLKLPFFIQWNEDSDQTASREDHLSKIAESLNSPSPSWPPGVIAYEERRYLILAKSLTRSEASAIATKAGGTLAIPSNESEASYLLEAVEKSGLSFLWIGGKKRNQTWTWSTNEPWEFARWSDGFPIGNNQASVLKSSATGWSNVKPDEECPGFIIEWSDDAKDAPKGDDAQTSGIESLDELRATAKRFLLNKQAETQKLINDNFDAQGFAMRQMMRNSAQEEAQKIQANYDKYLAQAASNDNRLPNPTNSDLIESRDAVKILTHYFLAQEEIEKVLDKESAKLRISYVAKIDGFIAEAQAKGLASQVKSMEEEQRGTGSSGTSFLRHLNLSGNQPTSQSGNETASQGDNETTSQGDNQSSAQGLTIISAEYGREDDDRSADVTETVRKLLRNRPKFKALVKLLGEDPIPGRNKTLEITFKFNEQIHSHSFERAAEVSNEILIAIANAKAQ